MLLAAVGKTIAAYGEYRVLLAARSTQVVELSGRRKLPVLGEGDRLIENQHSNISGVWKSGKVGETKVVNLARTNRGTRRTQGANRAELRISGYRVELGGGIVIAPASC